MIRKGDETVQVSLITQRRFALSMELHIPCSEPVLHLGEIHTEQIMHPEGRGSSQARYSWLRRPSRYVAWMVNCCVLPTRGTGSVWKLKDSTCYAMSGLPRTARQPATRTTHSVLLLKLVMVKNAMTIRYAYVSPSSLRGPLPMVSDFMAGVASSSLHRLSCQPEPISHRTRTLAASSLPRSIAVSS